MDQVTSGDQNWNEAVDEIESSEIHKAVLILQKDGFLTDEDAFGTMIFARGQSRLIYRLIQAGTQMVKYYQLVISIITMGKCSPYTTPRCFPTTKPRSDWMDMLGEKRSC